MKPAFAFMLACWTVVALFHLRQFARRRHPLSLAVAVYPLGWAAFAGWLAGWLRRPYSDAAVALGLVVGVIAAALCVASLVGELRGKGGR
jgi:hypothetical protein